MRHETLLSFIVFMGGLGFATTSFAQSPQITSINRCINSNPDCNGAVNNPGEIAIRWTTDPSSGSSDPVTRVYLHGPFNTTEGATPADPGHPDALCAGIGQGWDDTWHVWRDVDGTLCNFDDGTCLLPTPADGSSDPLSGMREPHCRLNLCGNGGEGFDREVCNPTPSDGGKAILVDGARESGSYFLVFEKESGAIEIAAQHYDPLPPSCGEVTAAFHSGNSPSVDVTLNPTNANRIAVTGCGQNTGREVTGDGSQTFNCPFRGTRKTLTFACQGAGSPDRRKVQVSLGNPTIQIDQPGYNPATSESVTVTYQVSRPAVIKTFHTIKIPLCSLWYAGHPGCSTVNYDLLTSFSSDSVPWVHGVKIEEGGYTPISLSNGDTAVWFWPSNSDLQLIWPGGNARADHQTSFVRDHSHCLITIEAIDFDGRHFPTVQNLCDFPTSFTVGQQGVIGNYSYENCFHFYNCGFAWLDECFSSHCNNYRMNIDAPVSCQNCVALYGWCDGWSHVSVDSPPSADRYDVQTSHFRVPDWEDPWRGHGNSDHPTARCIFWALTYDGRWITPDNNPSGWWDLHIPSTFCDGETYARERDRELTCVRRNSRDVAHGMRE